MQYPEDATQAANYLREAIPLMVKHKIQPNPRNFSLWYAYVSGRNKGLNQELDQIIAEHNTCPPEQALDLFRRYIIDDEVDFGHQVQNQLSRVIGSLSAQSSAMSVGSGEYEAFLEKGLKNLQQQSSEDELKVLVNTLLEQTRHTSKLTHSFKSQIEEANQQINKLRQELKSIQQEASLDPLTQINNRRSFDKEIKRLIDEHASGGSPFCLIVTDIDHFKRCNDEYGHVMGDKILQSFAEILRHVSKDIGFCARYGGEEFVLLLPEHSLEQATQVAEKIRITTERMQIKQRNMADPIDTVTTSLGVALYIAGETVSDFIGRTDALLYQAKESGRNRVAA
ncbi:MAG: GGDEF domain-containing protein [Pseudomonadales bacterium]|jgi:diguanylate cyclase